MTLGTLRFGSTASTITKKIAPSIKSDENAILTAYQRHIISLRSELDHAIQQIESFEATERKQLE